MKYLYVLYNRFGSIKNYLTPSDYKSNSSLLHKYGFCELSNKNGFVSIYSPFGKIKA